MSVTVLRQEWQQGPCPACGQPIMLEYAVDLGQLAEIPPGHIGAVSVNATVAGVRIHHDCIPKVAREHSIPPATPHEHSASCRCIKLQDVQRDLAQQSEQHVLDGGDARDLVVEMPEGKLSEAELRAQAAELGLDLKAN